LASRKYEYKHFAKKLNTLASIHTSGAGNAMHYHQNLKKAPVTLLLFDLDDTLLGNEMNKFVPAYLQALAKRMAMVADPAILIRTLMTATRQMVENPNPDQTLEEKFDAAFYSSLGLVRKDVQGIIDVFYAEDFPKLRGITQFRPEAVRVVQQLLDRGDQAAVATNPLFPRTAIVQRLNWAGLPVDQVPFALIPSYETFHFAKPNPAYFAEFLAQLGWPKIPVVMVGNDVESDINAARKLGLPVFWMTNDGTSTWNGQGAIPPHGELTDLIPWIDVSIPAAMTNNFNTPTALLSVLRSTPAALATLCCHKSHDLGRRPAPDEWSPNEVLCHLRDVDAEVNLARLQKVIKEWNPFLVGQDTDPWADTRQYCLQDGLHALVDFTQARLEVLQLLESISPEDWDLPARHAIFGPTNLRELVNIITGHDILHVRQVYQAL
jgi:FMN phosphatase YigB (HAD superfamily)